ncbi:MAG TPA: DUF3108 domain-containing protein [Methylophilaceae bacterium]|nr:DUF3108 domain-containing protein [Methylophilaceae bacterium]
MNMFLQIIARSLATGALLLTASMVQAAPKQVETVYQVTRGGQPFATITETFKHENGRYKIDSVTKGIGVYALLGKRILSSEGEVTAEGLKPSHFELHQGDNAKKSLYVDFDWPANLLTMKVKGNPTTAPLEKGTQDILSLVYQFMFVQPSGEEFTLPVTTGKKLRSYTYQVVERTEPVEVAAGKFKTIHMQNLGKENQAKEKDSDDKELWLGVESHYLPVRLIMHDENGAVIEQTLTSLHVE